MKEVIPLSKWYNAKDYTYEETGVQFHCTDDRIQNLYDSLTELCKDNIKQFGEMKIMKEGAKYDGVWLETQPMGGEMYACRDIEIALNNHLIFMKHQRRDGRMHGMITYIEPYKVTCVHQDWMQGDFFTPSAFRMYYLINKDKNYLQKLYECLRDFDEYLWAYRDSDGDGCLEAWCVWDTGDDNSTKLLTRRIHHCNHGLVSGEEPPTDYGMFPFESAEYMAYSYSHRIVLAKISEILDNGEADKWYKGAKEIQQKVADYLWDKDKKAVYDRDRNNEMMYTLTTSNIKCMYHGLFTQKMADEFIREHLVNPDEFFTHMPLPTIAANDPLFYVNDELNNLSEENKKLVEEFGGEDILDNAWAGTVQGLTIQRSVDALLNYNHVAEAAYIGRRWLDTLSKSDRIVQQYNPFTGEPCPGDNGYGPAILSALEYISYLYGVDYVCDTLRWGCAHNGCDSTFTQKLFGKEYTITHKEGIATAMCNGEEWFSVSEGVTIVTDMDGNIISVSGVEHNSKNITLSYKGCISDTTVKSNQIYKVIDNKLTFDKQIEYAIK